MTAPVSDTPSPSVVPPPVITQGRIKHYAAFIADMPRSRTVVIEVGELSALLDAYEENRRRTFLAREDIEALNYAAYRIEAWAGPNDASAKRVRAIAANLDGGQP